MSKPFLCFLILALAPISFSQGAVVYSEVPDGELEGNDNMSPTDLGFFMPGVNSVTGQVQGIGMGGFNGTADIFTFEIAAGQQLDTIVLTSFSTSAGGGLFMMLDDGNTFEFSPPDVNDQIDLPDLSLILGGSVVGTAHVGTDVLDNLANAVNFGNGSAFTTPLGPGQYSVYLQETGTFSNYSYNFNVSATAVPEPTTTAAMALTCGLIGFRRLRRRKVQVTKSEPENSSAQKS